MANVQSQFIEFHDNIKLDDENEILRDKREKVLNKLKQNIAKDVPTYTTFNQGSYAMFTGVKPLNGDYDIDVGIKFDIDKSDYEDPVKVKQWVYDALNGHTKEVKIKNPCVTVQYQINSEPVYHVDLAVYAAKNSDNKLYLSKGKPGSLAENKKWEESDPSKLMELIQNRYTHEKDRAQFRRVIRYLKRWKDIKFTSGGHAIPTGIAITIAAYDKMNPVYTTDSFTATRNYDDLKCLKNFVDSLINSFTDVVYDAEEKKYYYRLSINMITPQYSDLFEKMTNKQMESFKNKLETLQSVLKDAEKEVDPVESCKKLKDELGDDFPVPEKKDTAESKSKGPAVVSSNQGA